MKKPRTEKTGFWKNGVSEKTGFFTGFCSGARFYGVYFLRGLDLRAAATGTGRGFALAPETPCNKPRTKVRGCKKRGFQKTGFFTGFGSGAE